MNEISNAVFCILLGVGIHALGSILFQHFMDKPSVPKMPKDYRRICECMK